LAANQENFLYIGPAGAGFTVKTQDFGAKETPDFAALRRKTWWY
jgi:hypothetical protein